MKKITSMKGPFANFSLMSTFQFATIRIPWFKQQKLAILMYKRNNME